MKNIILIVLTLTAFSCAHSIHQVYTSDFSPSAKLDSGKLVTAKSEQFVILGFVKQTDYVNQAYLNLINQCPGQITGITTQLSTSMGFFSWTNKVLIQGLCLKN